MDYRVKNNHDFNGILIGMVLGDSYIGVNKTKTLAYLETLHKSSHKSYLVWKQKLVNYKFETTFKYKNNNGYDAFMIRTKFEKKLIYLRKDFYVNNRKTVKSNLLNRLTDLGLAIWYMDDGCLSLGRKNGKINRRNIFLNTQGFGLEGNQLIQKWLLSKYDISSNINQNRGFRLRLNTSNTLKFVEIVSPFVSLVPCMQYKIDLQYNLESRVQANSKRGES